MIKEINLVSGSVRTFATECELIEYIARRNGSNFSSTITVNTGRLKERVPMSHKKPYEGNTLFEFVVMNENEFKSSWGTWRTYSFGGFKDVIGYRKYLMYQDEYGRTIDIRQYWGIASTFQYEQSSYHTRKKRIARVKGVPVPLYKGRWNRWKSVQYANEARQNADPEVAECLKPRDRRKSFLRYEVPCSRKTYRVKSWKEQTKFRKQWEKSRVNL